MCSPSYGFRGTLLVVYCAKELLHKLQKILEQERKTFKNYQKVGMLLQKRADTRGVWMTIVESGWNVWVWLVGVVSRRRVWLAGSGCGWNLWVWLVGVVVRRYIDFLILLIPTPLVSSLFCSSIPTFVKF